MKTFTSNTVKPLTRKIVLSFILVMLASAAMHSQNCQASFTFSVNQNVVTFTNTSTGPGQPSYYWNFGDGNYAYSTNATNTYTNVGTYIVCLWMYDSLNFNCSSTFCDTIVITSVPPVPCNALFYAYPDSLNNTMNFYDASQGTPVAWFWDFGDGNTSTLQNPVHAYTNPGTYYVCMTEYTLIDTCIYCDSISFYPCNSAASFTVNTSNDPTFNFTNTSTGGYAPYYYWDFGDGNWASTQNAQHTYLYNGTYTVCLYMYDSLAINCGALACTTITVSNGQNIPCTASFVAYPDSLNTGMVYYYDMSTGGPFYSWFWDFGDGFTSTQQNPSHMYAQTGWYVICLTVFSQTDTCSTCDSVYVLKLAGVDELLFNGTLSYFPNPTSGPTTITYTLNQAAEVTLEVYDLMGNKVEALANNTSQNAGYHEMKWNAEGKAEGVYFVRITINGLTATGKLTVIK